MGRWKRPGWWVEAEPQPKFDLTSTWGQVEQRMDYWAQWMVKRIKALQGKAAAQ